MDAWKRKELEADLSAYLDGELPAERAAEVEALLRESQDARELLDSLGAVAAALAELPRERAPAELAEKVRAALAAPHRGQRSTTQPAADAGDATEATSDTLAPSPRSLVLSVFRAARVGGLMAACILFGIMLHAWWQPSPAALYSRPLASPGAAGARALQPQTGGYAFKDDDVAKAAEANEGRAAQPPTSSAPAALAAAAKPGIETEGFARRLRQAEPDVLPPGPVLRVEITPQSQVEYEAARHTLGMLYAVSAETVTPPGDAAPILHDTLETPPVTWQAPIAGQADAGESLTGPVAFNVVVPTSQPAAVLAALERAAPQQVFLSMRVADAAAALPDATRGFAGVDAGPPAAAERTESDRERPAIAERTARDELPANEESKQPAAAPAAPQTAAPAAPQIPGAEQHAEARGRAAPASAPAAAPGEQPAPAPAVAARPGTSTKGKKPPTAGDDRSGRFAGGRPAGEGSGRGRPASAGAPVPAAGGRGLGADQSALVLPPPTESAAADAPTVPEAAPASRSARPDSGNVDAVAEPGPYALSTLWLRLVEALSAGPIPLTSPLRARGNAPMEPEPPAATLIEITIHPPPASAPAKP